MKKIITLIVLLMMMCISVSALERYTGTPQMPYIIYGHVNWNDQMLAGTRLEIKNANTGYIETIATDSNGYYQTDGQNWLSISAGRPPVMYGDVITIKALDGCGTGDVCSITFTAYEGNNANYAALSAISLTGALSCPPANCPTCSGGGGGCSSSGGGVYIKEVEGDCPDCDCAQVGTCPEPVECPVNPSCPPEKICPSCPGSAFPVDTDGLTPGQLVMFVISAIGFASVGAYSGIQLTKDRISKVKNVTYRTAVERDGDIREEHRHPGLKQYHSIETMHREKHEQHKKGERFPIYEKDEDGVYRYVQ